MRHQTGTSARVFSMVSDMYIPAIRGMTSLKEGQSESFNSYSEFLEFYDCLLRIR